MQNLSVIVEFGRLLPVFVKVLGGESLWYLASMAMRAPPANMAIILSSSISVAIMPELHGQIQGCAVVLWVRITTKNAVTIIIRFP